MGTPFDCGTNKRDFELGDGIKKVGSWFQNPHILWKSKREKGGYPRTAS